jgi:hypothetical protein
MAAKKRKGKAKPKDEVLTAVKFVVHRANDVDEPNGMYRYVIVGMLVSNEPLANIPVDNKKVLVLSNVELGNLGVMPASMLHATLGTLNVRECNFQGNSADQNLVRLRDV